jgi:hypothetical protein
MGFKLSIPSTPLYTTTRAKQTVALLNDDTSLNTTARLNIITETTPYCIQQSWLQADQNWWGDNSGPNTTNGDSTQGQVTTSQWVSDPDNDGVLENDNCPAAFNPTQSDSDNDGKGNACDPTPETHWMRELPRFLKIQF